MWAVGGPCDLIRACPPIRCDPSQSCPQNRRHLDIRDSLCILRSAWLRAVCHPSDRVSDRVIGGVRKVESGTGDVNPTTCHGGWSMTAQYVPDPGRECVICVTRGGKGEDSGWVLRPGCYSMSWLRIFSVAACSALAPLGSRCCPKCFWMLSSWSGQTSSILSAPAWVIAR
jgi:hypothetical protein